ncbi:MAG TPA: phosphotransferase [Gemmatimonadales bacterium]|nr:phosphotransferase [Gemmatimonadales bacterium]
MRLRFKPPQEQRQALHAQLARLRQPEAALELLRPGLPGGFEPAHVDCAVQSVHPDRFVVQVRVCSSAGEQRVYALKVYSDDFGEQVWAHCRALAEHSPPDQDVLCLPTRYIELERTLVFPWVDGLFLSEIVDERKPELLRQAARVAADLHRLAVVPEQPTTAQMILDDTLARCGRLRDRWPVTTPLVEPLVDSLQETFASLDSSDPTPIHGDLAAGQFLWTGERLVLLDFDLFGYADPAYDAGHFLAQLERRCLLDATLPPDAGRWLSCFRDEYLAAMPSVSPRNVWFFHGLHLIRKIYTVCRRQPIEGPTLVHPLAVRAQAALEEAVAPRIAT